MDINDIEKAVKLKEELVEMSTIVDSLKMNGIKDYRIIEIIDNCGGLMRATSKDYIIDAIRAKAEEKVRELKKKIEEI